MNREASRKNKKASLSMDSLHRIGGPGRLAMVLALVFLGFAAAFVPAVHAQTPVPFVANPLVPSSTAPGTPGLTLTVHGANFTAGSVVNWNASPRATTYVNKWTLTATILASDLANPTTAAVTVTNPGVVAASNTIFFPINTSRALFGSSRTDMNIGSNPTGVVFADFNHDGFLDMAISNDIDNTVDIYSGNGQGGFTQTATYCVIASCPQNAMISPYNIAIGDLNNDGVLDLVTPNLLDNTISVLLGNPDGTFQPAVTYPCGNNPQSVVLGDFNGDGILDVAVPAYFDNAAAVLLGNGDGTFQAPVEYGVKQLPIDIKSADFNHDGILDLVVPDNEPNMVSVLLGNGDGTFQKQHTYNVGLSPNGVGVADINNDGYPDIITTNGGSTLSILLNNQHGGFNNAFEIKSGNYPSYVVQISDLLDESGKLEMTVPNFFFWMLDVYYGNGNGTFQSTPTVYPVQGQVDGMGVADFNGDGRLDIVALNEFDNSMSILIQSPVPPPVLSANVVNFGSVSVGQSVTSQAIILTNTSSTPLTINNFSFVGPTPNAFTFTKNTCSGTLLQNAKCGFQVQFTPTAAQKYAANIYISDSAGQQSTFLYGIGTAAATKKR